MRIGELAALVGVSTRTVRHYHHRGVLPEPERQSNGYREYGLREAVFLARIRRLVELGLSLDEIHDVLADDRGRELREVLQELDGDLARQQERIHAKRQRLAGLLGVAELDADSAISPEMATVLRDLPADGSEFGELDRTFLTVLDAHVDPTERAGLSELFKPLTDPEARARGRDINARMDELADADPDDPRVRALASDLADHLPEEMVAALINSLRDPSTSHWLKTMSRELSTAQARVFERLVAMLKERG